MKPILIAALLFGSNAVFATGSSGGPAATAVSTAIAAQAQNQRQNQNQGQSQNVSGSNTTISGGKWQHNAPGVMIGSAFPTAVCQRTLGFGFSFLLGGGAGAASITVEECMKLETIRVGVYMLQNSASEMNQDRMEQANYEVYCMTKYGGATSGCPKSAETKTAKSDAPFDASNDDVERTKFEDLGLILQPWEWGN